MTKRAVSLTRAAVDDVNEAKLWLHQSGAGSAARARYRAILRAMQGLATGAARHRHDPDDASRQIVSVEGYRIIFAVDPGSGDVTVLAVFGPGEP